MEMEVKIRSFVFFDLETTGIFEGTVAPKITEMALVAVARESIRHNEQNSLPRILHKLILPINPQKTIPTRIQYMTKLYNDDMELLKPFEFEIYELIVAFLNRLRPPICFVAHNGDKFDFPVLLSELKCINKVINIQ
ncbi:Three prime repair exonuclease 2 [Harpegnathos saltator]|uniref:Three prime repair exonuclease 2 n=1 Tax=Harpegnathos saltator TaxID=610380 RepID=E2BK07_HARSA|nr:Three prime repair exonuclease 2 [Harpegnathos saltator]